MRIGCLQFAPQVGDVNNNLNRADAVLNRADPDSLDLLVLPELAFSGKSNTFGLLFSPQSGCISPDWLGCNWAEVATTRGNSVMLIMNRIQF